MSATMRKEASEANNLEEIEEIKDSEMNQPCWSVITYESVAVSGLTYFEALEWLEKLKAQKISGLCIVTDTAAGRVEN